MKRKSYTTTDFRRQRTKLPALQLRYPRTFSQDGSLGITSRYSSVVKSPWATPRSSTSPEHREPISPTPNSAPSIHRARRYQQTRGSGVWLRYDLAFECEVGERVTTPPSINNDWLWPVLIGPSSLRPVPFERWRPADRSQPGWSLLASSDQNGSNIGHSKLHPRTKKCHSW